MKRHINLWLVMFLAISLALPIYSIAQTAPMKLTLESSTGDRISTPGIKSFAIGTDNNLVIYLDQPFNFVALLLDITVDDTAGTYSNCTVSSPASVTATQPAAGTDYTITFKVTSTTLGATFTMPVSPESIASFNSTTNTFSWNIGGSIPVAFGSYLAVFEGTSGADKSQLVVMININPPGYTLAVNIQGCAGSSVTKNPDKQAYNLSPQETVTLTPVPGNGCSFSGWSGDPLTTTNPATILMNGNKTVTATFTQTPTTHTLTTSVSPSGAGTVSGGGIYNHGQTATVTAQANAGYTFSNWSGAATGTNPTAQVVMDADKSVTANFTGGGGGTGTKTNPIKINKPTTKIGSGYIPSTSTDNGRGAVTVPAGQKLYFEVDPLATTNRSVSAFGVSVKFYSGIGAVCKLTQDKITGNYSSEDCRGYTSFMDIVYDNQPDEIDSKRFLYAIDNSGITSNANDEIWATIP